MRRHPHGRRKCAAEMKDAEACDAREIGVGVSRHDRSASKAEIGAPRRERPSAGCTHPVFSARKRKSTIRDAPFLRCDVPYLLLCDVHS